jgi:hypothetical protein
MSKESDRPITPEECLRKLPELKTETIKPTEEDGLRRAELRHSLRGIAQLNHVSETGLVRGLIEKVLGRLPTPEE